jgi:hypothetical protein
VGDMMAFAWAVPTDTTGDAMNAVAASEAE